MISQIMRRIGHVPTRTISLLSMSFGNGPKFSDR